MAKEGQHRTRSISSSVDIADSTRDQHRIQLDKLLPLIGNRPIDTLTPHDFADVVAALHGQNVARETIRKTLGAGAMTLDHAGIEPNPARDRMIKLPPDDSEEVNPPSAEQVEAVFRLIPLSTGWPCCSSTGRAPA